MGITCRLETQLNRQFDQPGKMPVYMFSAMLFPLDIYSISFFPAEQITIIITDVE